MNQKNTETHHFLPSGEWEGFYCYGDSPTQHKMAIELSFVDSVVSGSGIDDVAPFTWKGDYNLDTLKIRMMKTYPTHQIFYKGDIDQNGIWGTWDDRTDLSQHFNPETIRKMKEVFKDKIRGGFHIWPKTANSESKEATNEEAITESEKLKEIYIERLSVIQLILVVDHHHIQN